MLWPAVMANPRVTERTAGAKKGCERCCSDGHAWRECFDVETCAKDARAGRSFVWCSTFHAAAELRFAEAQRKLLLVGNMPSSWPRLEGEPPTTKNLKQSQFFYPRHGLSVATRGRCRRSCSCTKLAEVQQPGQNWLPYLENMREEADRTCFYTASVPPCGCPCSKDPAANDGDCGHRGFSVHLSGVLLDWPKLVNVVVAQHRHRDEYVGILTSEHIDCDVAVVVVVVAKEWNVTTVMTKDGCS